MNMSLVNIPEYSVSISIEELSRQTCMPLTEAEAAIQELVDRQLIKAIHHPLLSPRYIVNLDEIERQAKSRKNDIRGA